MAGKGVYTAKYEPSVSPDLVPRQTFIQTVLSASGDSVTYLSAFSPRFSTILDLSAPPTSFLPGKEN